MFCYNFLMTGNSLSNFNLQESHIAQFYIGSKKWFFFFKGNHVSPNLMHQVENMLMNLRHKRYIK